MITIIRFRHGPHESLPPWLFRVNKMTLRVRLTELMVHHDFGPRYTSHLARAPTFIFKDLVA